MGRFIAVSWVVLETVFSLYIRFTVTRSSNQGSVDGFRQERLQRLATFDSLLVQEERRKITNGKQNYRVLPRRNLEATEAVGANLRPFSFGGSVGPLRLSP